MRVSPTGWAFSTAEEVEDEAAKSAECTHSHPEGIKGAQAIALAIFNIRQKMWKNPLEDARLHCRRIYGDDYLERIPKEGEWNETCQGCVPLALHLFSQSSSFEDAVRKAVSYGGDSDTLGAIVGSLAEACYGVPTEIATKALSLLPTEMICVLSDFETKFNPESEVCKLLR
jgi:ADP-ribosylglycohydrolase